MDKFPFNIFGSEPDIGDIILSPHNLSLGYKILKIADGKYWVRLSPWSEKTQKWEVSEKDFSELIFID